MARVPRRLDHGEEATLVEHLDELRGRLIVSGASVFVTTAIAFVFHRRLIHALVQPLPKRHHQLLTLGVGEPFTTSLWVSVMAGVLMALPILLWQIWGFFIPAFDSKHERLLKAFVALATFLLVGGVAFGYYVALPAATHFLTNYDTTLYNVQIRARDYFTFASRVLLAMAIVFELPIFVLGLTRMGILSTAKLRRNRKIGYFTVCCIGVALPGIDPITTIFETVPLLILYEGSIWLSALLDRRSQRASTALET